MLGFKNWERGPIVDFSASERRLAAIRKDAARPRSQNHEGLITAREVAKHLNIATGTVLDWFEAGKLPGYKLGPNGAVRFRSSEVEEWLAGCRATQVGESA